MPRSTAARRSRARVLLLPLGLVLTVTATAAAQRDTASAASSPRAILAAEHYVKPPAEIERLVTAPRQNNATLSDQSPVFRWR